MTNINLESFGLSQTDIDKIIEHFGKPIFDRYCNMVSVECITSPEDNLKIANKLAYFATRLQYIADMLIIQRKEESKTYTEDRLKYISEIYTDMSNARYRGLHSKMQMSIVATVDKLNTNLDNIRTEIRSFKQPSNVFTEKLAKIQNSLDNVSNNIAALKEGDEET